MASGYYMSPWRLATVGLVLLLLLALPLVFMQVKYSWQKAGPAENSRGEPSGPNPIALIPRETAALHVEMMVEPLAFSQEKRGRLVDRQMKAYDLLRRLTPDKFTIDTLEDLKTKHYPNFRRIFSNYQTRLGLFREGHDWRKKAP